MQTRSIIKLAREGGSLAFVPIRHLSDAIVTVELRRLKGDEKKGDEVVLCNLHKARVAAAEESLAGFRDDAAKEAAR